MNRREALERVALIFGGTVIGGAAFLQGCKSSDKGGFVFSLTPEQIALLDEVAETIIPTTNTPGAKAAKVGEFMQVMVTDCYEEKDQQIFSEGLNKIDTASKSKYSKSFIEVTPEERTALFNEINKELKKFQEECFLKLHHLHRSPHCLLYHLMLLNKSRSLDFAQNQHCIRYEQLFSSIVLNHSEQLTNYLILSK